jgi:SanA protein
MKIIIRRLLQFFLPIIILWLFVLFIINYWVLSFSKEGFFTDVKNLPKIEVWLVFWASVKKNLEPSDTLRDRLDVAIFAYKKWKIKKIIVSWDNWMEWYNEPTAMYKYLKKNWVNSDDIYLDYAGFDTYDSLYRAKYLFWVEKVTLFTQDFHLKRAMYIAKRLEYKEVVWIQTNLRKYIAENYNNRREILARVKAFLDLEINNSKPIVLGELIDMNEVQEKN